MQVDDRYTISDLIWLMHTYIRNMNDEETPIITLEKYLITNISNLSNEDMGRLLECYQLKGRISRNVYEIVIKPYIIRNKMDSMENLIDMVKFTICSES